MFKLKSKAWVQPRTHHGSLKLIVSVIDSMTMSAPPLEFQQIASVDTDTGEFQEKRLAHREEAEKFY